MADREWTRRQREAIELRGENALVSAGAGSGKTAVMTERIVRLILEGASVRDMLVVTFTDAAASEMRARIQRGLKEAAQNSLIEAKTRAHAAAEYSIFYESNISTLHSFCASVIRRHFELCGIDPRLRVLDSYRSEILKASAVDDVINRRFDARDADFLKLDDDFGEGREGLSPLVRRLCEFMETLAEPEKWLEEAVEFYALDEDGFIASDSSALALADAAKSLDKGIELLKKAFSVLPDCAELQKFRGLAEAELSRLMELRGAVNGGGRAAFDSLRSLGDLKFLSLNSLPRKFSIEIDREKLKTYRDAAKARIREIPFEQFDAAEQTQVNKALYGRLCALKALALDYRSEYAAKKKALGAIDYSDMERGAITALSGEAAEEYREKFKYIFVDEYQDVNPVQEKLISLIRRENALFCVGDVKQSIYGFRGADPSIFSECMERFKSGGGGRFIPMNTNFRSSPNILAAVNDVFCRAMPLGGELDYTGDDALLPGNPAKAEINPPVTLSLLQKTEGADNTALEASHVAEIIKSALGRPLSGGKAVDYGDIAVLLRSPRGKAEKYARVFAAQGIPVSAELTGGFFEAIEIRTLMNLLKLIDNPRQDVPLLGVMRSGLFGLTDAGAAALRLKYPKLELCEAFALECADCQSAEPDADEEANGQADEAESGDKSAKKTEPEHARAYAALMNFIQRARMNSRGMRLEALVRWVIEETRFRELTRVMPDGARRLANVEGFIRLARDFESSSPRGVSGLLKNIDDALRSKQDIGERGAVSGGLNCVSIMSVHHSKGMEYPVVIIAQCGGGFNVTDANRRVIFNAKLGLCAKLADREEQRSMETLCHFTAARLIREKTVLADELRTLYVAMTRAQEYLFMTGLDSKPAESPRCYADCVKLAFERDGQMLRTDGCRSRWNIEYALVFAENAAKLDEQKSAGIQELLRGFADSPVFAEPYRPIELKTCGVVGKISASELDRAEGEPETPPVPRFVQATDMSAADAGTAAHIALRHMDFARAASREQVSAQLQEMLSRRILAPEQLEAVKINQLVAFAQSELGRRITASPRVERELPFSLLVTPAELLQMSGLAELAKLDAASTDRLCVQGIIDLCFEERDSWILLDYKTDRVLPTPQAAAQKHARQLALYASALQMLTRKPVAQSYIYFLKTGDAVRL